MHLKLFLIYFSDFGHCEVNFMASWSLKPALRALLGKDIDASGHWVPHLEDDEDKWNQRPEPTLLGQW